MDVYIFSVFIFRPYTSRKQILVDVLWKILKRFAGVNLGRIVAVLHARSGGTFYILARAFLWCSSFSRELYSAKIPTAIKWNSEYTLKMGDNSLEIGRTVWFGGKKDIGNGSLD